MREEKTNHKKAIETLRVVTTRSIVPYLHIHIHNNRDGCIFSFGHVDAIKKCVYTLFVVIFFSCAVWRETEGD